MKESPSEKHPPSRLPPFVLVTGNAGKIRETRRIVGRELDNEPLDLPEIQSLDLVEVLEAKAREAFKRLGRAVVVEETGLFLDALNGFPGPLVKWMLESVGPEGIARTCQGLGNMNAQARCALAYFDGERLLNAEGETRGKLVLEPKGRHGFGWDPIFVPEESELTYAQLSAEEKDQIGHRGRAWRSFCSLLGAG